MLNEHSFQKGSLQKSSPHEGSARTTNHESQIASIASQGDASTRATFIHGAVAQGSVLREALHRKTKLPGSRRLQRARLGWLVLCLLVPITLWAGCMAGAYPVNWSHAWDVGQQPVLWQIRIPRLLMGLLIGAVLAVSGVLMQAMLRNPLADPGLLGLSSGASLAVGGVLLFWPATRHLPEWLTVYLQSGAAFLGALGACVLIFKLASSQGRVAVVHLLLSGLALNALAGAALGILYYISDDQQLRALSFWSMGSLGGARWSQWLALAAILLPLLLIALKMANRLNLLSLGEQEAAYLGVSVERLKKQMVALIAIGVGLSVATSGLIGFVGLMVPHLCRLLFGANHRQLVPASALMGAILLANADTLGRTMVIPAELPVGLLTGLLGSLFFMLLLRQTMRKSE